MSRVPPRTLALLAAALALPALTAASCAEEPSGVTLGTTATGTVAEIVEAPGSVTARAAATVRSPADGTLGELRVEPGQRVTRGTVVAVVDAPAAEQRLADAERALDQAPSASGGLSGGSSTGVLVSTTRGTDKRAAEAFDDAREAAADVTDPEVRKALTAQIDAAEEQYSAASHAANQAVRQVQQGLAGLSRAVGSIGAAQRLQAEQAYALAAAAVDALTLKAPATGIVQLGGTTSGGTPSLTDLIAGGGSGPGAVAPAGGGGGPLPGVDASVPEGAPVSAGTPIVTIVDTGTLGLAADVDETDVLLVKEGGAATVELDAATGATYAATVRAIDLLPTTSARGGVSYRVRLDLGKGTFADDTEAPTPRPGMSAVVRLRVREAGDAVTVPASAIVNADGRDTVWAVTGGRAERVPVTLGVQGEDVVQVTEGIGAGQSIVVSGADQVSPGQELP